MYNAVGRVHRVRLQLPWMGRDLSPERCVAVGYYCDSSGNYTLEFHFGVWIDLPAMIADATLTDFAPFGLLQGLGLNDPWV